MAEELFRQFAYTIRTEEDEEGYFTNIFQAKELALICVNTILKLSHPYTIVYSKFVKDSLVEYAQEHYWILVKKELLNKN